MKKSLLISAGVLTLFGVSATLFAQTATGGSIITEMKASIRSFTLASDLNPGTTGLQSYPVTGKETGDMLTAGEWNRVLELVAQGGGGGGGAGFEVNDTTTKTRYSIIWNGISWANNPKHMAGIGGDYTSLANCGTYFAGTLTPNCKMIETAAHDFCQIVFTGGGVTHSELNYIGAKKWRIISSGFASFTNGTIVECYDNAGGGNGGGTGGGSSWVDVPLTDTADYDVSCQYRLTMSFADDVNRKWHNATSATYYISMISSKYLGIGIYNADQNYYGIPSTTKSQYGYRSPAGVFAQSSNVTVTKLEKKC